MNELKGLNWNARIEMTWTNEWMFEWMNEWMNGLKWMNWNEWIEMNELKWMNWNEWIEVNELKWIEWLAKRGPNPPVFFTFFMWNRALATVSCTRHVLPTSSSKSAPSPSVFLNIFKWQSSSRYNLVHLLSTSSSKCAPGPTVFYDFDMKSSSRYSPVHFLSTTFPDRAAQPRKRRPSFGDHGSHFTPKNTRFRARECFQARILAFPISHTSQLLAWWCSCHDERGDGDDVVAIMVRKLAMTIVRKFPI